MFRVFLRWSKPLKLSNLETFLFGITKVLPGKLRWVPTRLPVWFVPGGTVV
jgi:hypothetical protein